MIKDKSTPGPVLATRMFKQMFSEPNVFTPNVIQCGAKNGDLWELSWGRMLGEEKRYGVTVIVQKHKHEYEHSHELSNSFATEEQAREYINNGFRLERE